MSIQRYTYVGNDNDDIETNVNGEFVKQTIVFAEEIIRLKNKFDTQVEELEKALTEISRVADFPPVDKIISELARQALKIK